MKNRFFTFIVMLPLLTFAQHVINGKFTPPEDFNFAILYKVTPTTSIYVANAEISEKGDFMFNLDSTVTKGMYRVVYALPQEDYNFDIIYNGIEDIALEFNMSEGVSYLKSEENILLSTYHKSINLVSEKINQFYSQDEPSEENFKMIFDILRQTQSEFETASKGKIAHEFIKASRPYIPIQFEDASTFSKNFKDNYFKSIDFSNVVLQNSNFLIETTLNYVFSFIDLEDENKAIQNNIDSAVMAIGNNPIIKKILLKILWQQVANQGNENIANYISSTYLLNIAKQTKDQKLIKILSSFKAISIGETAPDFNMEIKGENEQPILTKLSELQNAKQYILVFWSSTCSHCLEELPKLKRYLASKQEDQIQVIAIGLEDEHNGWKEQTFDFPNFIHVYGEGKWENAIGNDYVVDATPTYFILGTDKKIIAKPFDFDAVKVYFEGINKSN